MRRPLATVLGFLCRVFHTDAGGEPGGSSAPSSATASIPETDAGISKADIVSETGLTPEEYLLQFVGMHGGRVEQQRVVALTGWSESTVSQALSEMEAQGLVARVEVGRKKIVCLPEATLDADGTERETAV